MPQKLRVGSIDDFVSEERIALQRGLTRQAGAVLGKVRTALAYVNHGRWVVDCPFGCGSARMAHEGKGFWCVECGNAAVGGIEVPLDWPADRDAIAALLVVRPIESRNWDPDESIEKLRAENEEHGLEAA